MPVYLQAGRVKLVEAEQRRVNMTKWVMRFARFARASERHLPPNARSEDIQLDSTGPGFWIVVVSGGDIVLPVVSTFSL